MEQEIIRIPEKGATYYYVRADIGTGRFIIMSSTWSGSFFSQSRLAKGNVFCTMEEAKEVADLCNRRLTKIQSSQSRVLKI